jgi:hypothetical protein
MKRTLELIPLVLAMGCSSYTIPTQHISAPHATIQKAEQMPVTNSQEATDRLALAKRELDAARTLQAKGQDRHADLMYLRADADARVAMSTAEEQGIAAEAANIQQQVRELRSPPPQQPSAPSPQQP